MFVDYTWQDWQAIGSDESKRQELLHKIVDAYRSSHDFKYALTAAKYFVGENPTIRKKVVLSMGAQQVDDPNDTTGKRKRTVRRQVELKGVQMPNRQLYTFITQENQHLLGNGVSFAGEDDVKARLGVNFDTDLSRLGEKALLHGVCYAYWNYDHMEIMPAAVDQASGCVVLLDERNSVPMMAVQFWQVSNTRPVYFRLFEPDGVTVYRTTKGKKELEITEPKRHYVQTTYTDAVGTDVVDERDYVALPVIPLYANDEHMSELTDALREKIDCYDRILSDFGDNLQRANDVYWVLNNFGGTTDDILQMLEDIQRLKAVATFTDGTGGNATAEPCTIEVPYAARQVALDVLRKAMYDDAMALDMSQLTGGSLTNVAIKAATANLNLKCDRFEWQVVDFMKKLLTLVGAPDAADRMTLTRRSITNDTETIQAIYQAREDIDQRTALKLNPLVNPDDIDDIIAATEAEKQAREADYDMIDRMVAGMQNGQQRLTQPPTEGDDD